MKTKIPVIFCIDVEPDARAIEPTEQRDWEGFETTWAYFASVRPTLELVTGAPAHYSWFVRMDPQVTHTYGTPDWAVTRYRHIFAGMQRARDEIGLHTHAWRWDDAAGEWISDFADQNWIEHCVEQGFEHYAQCFGRPCRSFRFGDRWLNQPTAEMIERLGARFDLTVEPGRSPAPLLESFTGSLPDYSLALRQPYHLSNRSFMQPDTTPTANRLWMIPISTASIRWAFPPLSLEPRGALPSSIETAYEGSLDLVDQSWIRGWVYDSRHPDMIVNVDLYDDGQFVATYAADIVRADLLTYTKSSGAHSFAIPVPEDRKDGRSHNVSIRASGSAYELDLSPVAITWHADDTSADYQTMDLAMSDQLFGRLFDALVYDRCVPVLALVLRTGAFSKPDMTSNCVRNFQYLLNHPMANHFVSATPAEAFKLLCAQRESSVQSRWAVG